MTKIDLKAYAKINLFLEITGKRDNGYHDISTVMHSIGLYDNISLSLQTHNEIRISSDSATMPTDKRNIVYKCAEAFFDALETENKGLDIYIEKNIPMEAGLGGGSADGAAVLNALNELYSLPFSKAQLCEIGKGVGADIPFCIMGGAMLAEGIGEILTPCDTLPECTILIAKDKVGISTKEAYNNIDSIIDRKTVKNNMPALLKQGSITEICNGMYNCFEYLVPSVEELKAVMQKHGAINSMMSGSGSAVFGIFEDKRNARKALEVFKQKGIFAAVCE